MEDTTQQACKHRHRFEILLQYVITDLYVVLHSQFGPHCDVSSWNASCVITRTSNAAIFSHSCRDTSVVKVLAKK